MQNLMFCFHVNVQPCLNSTESHMPVLLDLFTHTTNISGKNRWSLLGTLSKVVEKILLKTIIKIEKELQIEHETQFGFTSGHKNTHQVTRLVTDVICAYKKDMNTVMTLLDIEKAFDRVRQGAKLLIDSTPHTPRSTTRICLRTKIVQYLCFWFPSFPTQKLPICWRYITLCSLLLCADGK